MLINDIIYTFCCFAFQCFNFAFSLPPAYLGSYEDIDFNAERVCTLLVGILVFLRVSFYLNDYIPLIVAILFLFALLNFFISRMKAPILFMRTVALLVFIVATFPNFPWTKELLIFGYLVGGAVTLFSLAKQLQWFLEKKYG